MPTGFVGGVPKARAKCKRAREKLCGPEITHVQKKIGFFPLIFVLISSVLKACVVGARKENRACAQGVSLPLPPPLPRGKSAEHDWRLRKKEPLFPPLASRPFLLFSFLAPTTRGRGDDPQFISGNWCDIKTLSSVSATLPLSQNHVNFLGALKRNKRTRNTIPSMRYMVLMVYLV